MTAANPQLPLPDFERPPVAEVVLAVSFDPSPRLNVGLLGQFWAEQLRDEFPVLEEQLPYEQPEERFDGPHPPAVNLAVSEGPVPVRLFAKNESGTQVVQLQRGWFACNWQDAGGTNPYPRYPAVEAFFLEHLRSFVSFLKTEGAGELAATGCEVTYVNHIFPAERVWTDHGDFHRVVRLAGAAGSGFLGRCESLNLLGQYVMSDGGLPYGRLHISAQSVYRREDDAPVVLLTLNARGRPLGGQDEEGIINFLHRGREWVVRGFSDVTTEEMQQYWGRRA